MVTADDVAKYVGDRLAAEATFAAAVPGGAWNAGETGAGGPDSPAAYPYATFRVQAGPPRFYSGNAYSQTFTVRVQAFAPVGASGSDPAAVQKAVWKALAWSGVTALRNPTEAVLSVRPLEPAGRFDPTRRQARDVFVAGHAVEVTVQGDRSVV